MNWPNCYDTSLIGFLEMFALQGKDFTCNAFLTQSNKKLKLLVFNQQAK